MSAPPIRSILVGVEVGEHDGPDAVLATAVALAGALGADLHAVHAVESGPFDPPLLTSITEELEMAASALNIHLEDQLSAGTELASRRVGLGRAHRVLADRAAEVEADLLVLGPHRGHLPGAALGTTTDRLLRTTPIPCWIARGPLELPLGSLAVATDFSAESKPALDLALVLADGLGGAADSPGTPPPELDLLHVEWPAMLRDDPQKEERELIPAMAGEFAGAVARTGLEHAAIHRPYVVADVEASRGILTHAAHADPDVVVLGTHGRGAIARTLLGSVAAHVARGASGHVVLVPPREA